MSHNCFVQKDQDRSALIKLHTTLCCYLCGPAKHCCCCCCCLQQPAVSSCLCALYCLDHASNICNHCQVEVCYAADLQSSAAVVAAALNSHNNWLYLHAYASLKVWIMLLMSVTFRSAGFCSTFCKMKQQQQQKQKRKPPCGHEKLYRSVTQKQENTVCKESTSASA